MNQLNTTSSSFFFSRTLNLIYSVKFNSKKEINIVVWDIGLTNLERKILRAMGVEVIKVKAFCSFWRECYTWKPYVYKMSKSRYFLHLDSGNTVLCDLNEIFEIIRDKGHFFVDQGQNLSQIAPPDYFKFFSLDDAYQYPVIAAGNIGFDRSLLNITKVIEMTYASALDGMCLGYSEKESSRALGKKFIVRNCEIFRHDQTVLNCALNSVSKDHVILPHEIYSAIRMTPDVKILNQRVISYKFIIKQLDRKKIFVLIYCYINDSTFYLKNWLQKIRVRLVSILKS